jgi:hypothetical protein
MVRRYTQIYEEQVVHETHFQNRCFEQPQICITSEESKSLPSQVNVQTVLIRRTVSGSCDRLHLTTLILFSSSSS